MRRLIPVLKQDGVDTDLIMLIRTILAAARKSRFGSGGVGGDLGSTLNENIQGVCRRSWMWWRITV